MLALLVRAIALVTLLAGLVACERTSPPPLITATDFGPREAEVGDRLEISGAGFPKGKTAHVTFRGVLHRPGEAPTRADIEAPGFATSAQRIELGLTEVLQSQFCGRGDRAIHTTFRGDVEVAFPAIVAGAPPVAAMVPNVALDLRPGSPSRSALESRRVEATRVLAFLGITMGSEPAHAGGLVVHAVVAESRAEEAGIAAGDVLTSLDGVRVTALEDLVPSGMQARVAMGVRRGDAPEVVKDVPVDGYRFATPRNLMGAAIVLIALASVVFLFFSPSTTLLAWLERRVASRYHNPHANPRGHLGVSRARAFLRGAFRAPMSVVATLCASFLFATMPFGRYVVMADLDIGLLFLLAVTSLATIGFLTGGFRGAARIVSFELPAALAIACVVLLTGSTRLYDIVRAQGGAPWEWNAFRSPFALALFALHFASTLAQSSLAPPALAEADAEPRPVEQGPLARRVSQIAEWANIVVTCGMGAALFLGGWQVPGTTLAQQHGQLGLELLGSVVFLAKGALLVGLATLLRRALPVVRIEQTMRFCWRWLVPLGAAAFLMTLAYLAWNPGEVVERTFALATCAMARMGILRFLHRVRYAAQAASSDAPTSAFL